MTAAHVAMAVACLSADARIWHVARCPYCRRSHGHRVTTGACEPRDVLGEVKTPCQRRYVLREADRCQLAMRGVS